jgi:hypothetical protein
MITIARVYVFYSLPNDLGFLFFFFIFILFLYLLVKLIEGDVIKRQYEKNNFTNSGKKYYELSGTQISVILISWLIMSLVFGRMISDILVEDVKNDNTFLMILGWSIILLGWIIPYIIFRSFNSLKNKLSN